MKVVSFSQQWNDELRAVLDPGIQFVAIDRDDTQARERELPDADVLFTAVFDRTMAGQCRSLRLILCPAAGTDGIDRSSVPDGVRVLNSSGPEFPMAEYAIGALVALRQNFLRADRDLRQGRWTQGWLATDSWTGELFDSTLGLIGFGRVGQEIAKRAAAFGMHCRALTIHSKEPKRYREYLEKLDDLKDPAAVDSLVAWSDAVVVCSELSEVTRGLLNARRFGLMKPSAVLVNVARGPIVEERDLFEALKSRRIAGAAIDVWYRYPDGPRETMLPSLFPFQDLDNVLMTPHSSAWTLPHKRRKLAYWSKVLGDFARGTFDARR